MLRQAGIRELRYPVPWHRIERDFGHWDWGWLDGPMEAMFRLGMRPILDPLHHVSFPNWLEDGFLHPEFPALYCRFLIELARRYPWVEHYTVFNEPLPTVLHCSHNGQWYPHHRSDSHFVRMAANAARAICLATAELRSFNSRVQLVHIDTCEHHRALDRQAEMWVEHANHRRFLFHDLVLGRIGRTHPLLPYLMDNGFEGGLAAVAGGSSRAVRYSRT